MSRLPRSCKCGRLHRSGERCPLIGAPLSSIGYWPALRKKILIRDSYICWLCDLPGANTVDHVMPRSLGGTNDEWNLRAAHRSCNSKKGVS
jgi:5-methylcytosine-specific restriction endonuclease McrA